MLTTVTTDYNMNDTNQYNTQMLSFYQMLKTTVKFV